MCPWRGLLDRYQVSKQRLVRRVYNRIPGRGVRINRTGIYRLLGIERRWVFAWFIGIDWARRVFDRFIGSGVGTGSRAGPIRPVVAARTILRAPVQGILGLSFHEVYSGIIPIVEQGAVSINAAARAGAHFFNFWRYTIYQVHSFPRLRRETAKGSRTAQGRTRVPISI